MQWNGNAACDLSMKWKINFQKLVWETPHGQIWLPKGHALMMLFTFEVKYTSHSCREMGRLPLSGYRKNSEGGRDSGHRCRRSGRARAEITLAGVRDGVSCVGPKRTVWYLVSWDIEVRWITTPPGIRRNWFWWHSSEYMPLSKMFVGGTSPSEHFKLTIHSANKLTFGL